MANRSTQTWKSMGVLQVLALLCCLTLAVAIPAATDCKTYKLEVPDPASLKLSEGEHTIAGVATDHGRFEARVTVKNKEISEPHYFLGGKLLKPTPESEVPGDLRDCLKKDLKRSAISGHLWENPTAASTRWMPASYVPEPTAVCYTNVSCGAPNFFGRRQCCAAAYCRFSDGSGNLALYCGIY
jgi:hypothetical protein